MSDNTCLNCRGTEIIGNVKVIDRGEGNSKHIFTLQTYRNPKAIIFKGTIEAKVKARVCGQCGYVMLFTTPSEAMTLREGQ